MRRLLLIPLILASACSAKSPPEAAPSDLSLGNCDATKAQFAVGQMATPALLAKVKAASKADTVRQLKPGQIVSMEYTNMRVNLELDASGKVIKVRCG